MAYASLEELKQYLNMGSVTDHDTLLTRQLIAAETWINKRLNRRFGFEYDTVSETYYLKGNERIFTLSLLPIDSDETLTVTLDGIELASTDYLLDEESGVLELLSTSTANIVWQGWGSSRPALVVAYSGGYLDTPEDIKEATLFKAAQMFNASQGTYSEKNNYSDTYIDSLIMPYRRIPV
jgi:hypothetical protein